MSIPPFEPRTQVSFARRLLEIDGMHLGPALASAVERVSIKDLDEQLARFVPDDHLGRVAAAGLRGERLFPVPVLLEDSPRLIAYYRLLYGLSQKEFYRTLGRFRSMEVRGVVSEAAREDLDELCSSLCETAWLLFQGADAFDTARIRDLQLLTLGAQLRGGSLNKRGRDATKLVFERIRAAVADSAIEEESKSHLLVRNASGRLVRISFSADPDIAIAEELTEGFENRLAIEIKGGTDVSNIHNRLGEAEKSHQKAQGEGFREFWTIINAPVGAEAARRASPTTQEFFQLEEIRGSTNAEWTRFRDQLTSRLGVPAAG